MEINIQLPAEVSLLRPSPERAARFPIAILGVPFDNVTTAETVRAVEQMIASGQPHYFVTANVDFLVQAQTDEALRHILANADLVLCDGTPLLWASRLLGNALPERVAGSDLVPVLLELAARKKYSVYFLGAAPEAAAEAVRRLRVAYPSLEIAGHYSPPVRALEDMDHDEIKRRITEAKPDMLFVAFGCPKAEKWIDMHYRDLGVPVVAGVGATVDFLAGRVKRAPVWMRRAGLEWLFRLAQEPRRLWRRYSRDLWVFAWKLLVQWALLFRRAETDLPRVTDCGGQRCVLDISAVPRLDSTLTGRLLVLQRQLHASGRQLVLASPSRRVTRALALLGMQTDFVMAPAFVGGGQQRAA